MNKKQYMKPQPVAMEMELCEMIAISNASTNAGLKWEDVMEDDVENR
jgi:hypothetical protein